MFCSNLLGWGVEFYDSKLIFDTMCFCIPGRTVPSIKVEELGLLNVFPVQRNSLFIVFMQCCSNELGVSVV